MQAEYDRYIATGGLKGECKLCQAQSVKEFQLWRVINNKFPYDRVASVSHMIIPTRHASEKEVTAEEWAELTTIKDEYVHPTYDFLIEAAHHKKSIPGHYHIHLIVGIETP
jgi:hypothetical protein